MSEKRQHPLSILPEMKWMLRFGPVIFKLREVQSGQAAPVPPGEHILGRDDGTGITIDHPSISRTHARVYNDSNGQIWVEDLHSTNGTAVRGARIREKTLINLGDLISFGTVIFRLEPEVMDSGAPLVDTLKPAPRKASLRRPTEPVPASFSIPAGSMEIQSSASARTPQPVSSAPRRVTEALPQNITATLPVEEKKELNRPIPNLPVEAPSFAFGLSPLQIVCFIFGAGMAVGLIFGMFFAKYLFVK